MAKLDWLPEELLPVAMRVARADELCHEVIRESYEWSLSDPVKTVRRRSDGLEQLVVKSVAELPPIVGLHFSEAVNHLRAAIDNAVYGVAVRHHDGELSERQEKAIEFPIREDPAAFGQWQEQRRKKGVPQLAEGPLGEAIAALQPCVDTGRAVPSVSARAAQQLGMTVDRVHPLLLLQGYSNEDKHRALRLTVHQNIVAGDSEDPAIERYEMRRVRPDDVLCSTPLGVQRMAVNRPYMAIERPGTSRVPVTPGRELGQLVRYVAEVAVPILVTGAIRDRGLPVQMHLTGTADSAAQRIEAAGYTTAEQRYQPVYEARELLRAFDPPDRPPLED